MDKKQVTKIADKEAIKEVHKHEHHLHKGKPVTKMAKGGITSAQAKAVGRNMARANNQKSGSRGR